MTDPHAHRYDIAAKTDTTVTFACVEEGCSAQRELPLCGAPTRKGTPCKVTVRTDLGYTSCAMHGPHADKIKAKAVRALLAAKKAATGRSGPLRA